jgi:serine/threonine-protein kinase
MGGWDSILEGEEVQPSEDSESDYEDSLMRRVAGCYSEPAAEALVPELAAVIDGKYVLDRLLGRGGMGCVFAARHATTGREVAIKWMLGRGDVEQQRLRFLREARAAGRICHRNVIDIYDVVSSAQGTYLVMELLTGESLRAHMNRGPLSPAHAVGVAVEVLEGLAVAHQRGVIHRDLKPENVFLCSAPEQGVKILDFGISVLRDTQPLPESNLTRTGYFVGTPVYTALERLREKQPFDHRVDLYSVGVMLYEALTGRLPFSGKSPSELTYQLTTGTPRPLRALCPGLPRSVEAVVLKALARDPEQRFADARSFSEALRRALAVSDVRRGKRIALRAGAFVAAFGALGWAAVASSGASADEGRSRLRVSAARSAAFVAVAAADSVTAPPVAARGHASGESSPSLASEQTATGPGNTQRRAPPAPSRTSSARTANATLTVIAFPYGEVWVDGKSVGSSPAVLTLPPGRHVVSGGRTIHERQAVVELTPGDTRQVVLSWAKGARTAESEAGADGSPVEVQTAGRGPDGETARP